MRSVMLPMPLVKEQQPVHRAPECEISSSTRAHASLDLRVTPQNATAIPAIHCRLVGVFVSALEFFLSLILVLRLSSRDRNASEHPAKICSR